MTNDCVYEDVTLGESHAGRDEIAKFVDRMSTEFTDDFTFDLLGAASPDDHYWAKPGPQGHAQRCCSAIPADGEGLRHRGQTPAVGTRQRRKIKANRDYWDMANFLTQVGLAPPPPS